VKRERSDATELCMVLEHGRRDRQTAVGEGGGRSSREPTDCHDDSHGETPRTRTHHTVQRVQTQALWTARDESPPVP